MNAGVILIIRLPALSTETIKNAPAWKECPNYDTKTCDGHTPVLEFWEMQRTPSLPLTPGQL